MDEQIHRTSTRRAWVRPEVTEYASLTALTKYAPPGAFAMLFMTGSEIQCWDTKGPIPCPPDGP